MLLTPYGLREWLGLTIICALLAAGLWWFIGPWALVAVGLPWLALMSFFRDPPRALPRDLKPGDMISPADGVISAIEWRDDHPSVEGKAIVIRIFLSVLNVHVNRAPCDCEVLSLTHTPGRYLNAQTPESALVNESMLIHLRTSEPLGAERFGVKQISGMIARRIVCPLKPGDRLARCRRFGMIKFGSTTELILPRPDDVILKVAVGQRVRGARTILAELQPRSAR